MLQISISLFLYDSYYTNLILRSKNIIFFNQKASYPLKSIFMLILRGVKSPGISNKKTIFLSKIDLILQHSFLQKQYTHSNGPLPTFGYLSYNLSRSAKYASVSNPHLTQISSWGHLVKKINNSCWGPDLENTGDGGAIRTSIHSILPSSSWMCEPMHCLVKDFFLRHMRTFFLDFVVQTVQ